MTCSATEGERRHASHRGDLRARSGGVLVLVAVALGVTACAGPISSVGADRSTAVVRPELPGVPSSNPPTGGSSTATPDARESEPEQSGPTEDSSDAADAAAAIAALATLPVKGRAPKTGYARTEFGQRWSDDVTVELGHNGCDTRNDILKQLDDVVIKPGTRGCVVLSGTLQDPYTGRRIPFTRGAATSSAVQIDHVVALSDAWQKGAQQLSAAERRDFANDPRNLQPTDGATNARKGDGDAATWLPPRKSYRCTYVARQIEVKASYRLWVTTAEKAAMQRILSGCTAPH